MMENLNATVNGTQSAQTCYSPSSLTAAKIGKTFACCLFLVVSLAGNTLIAVIIYKTKTMRTTTNYFILNMAISDVLLPILVFPSSLLEIDESFSLFSGEQGQAFCRVKFFIQYVSSLVSIVNLVLIAVDRFGAVVFPFRRPLIGSKRCPFFILTTWVALIVLSSPIFFSYKSVEHTGRLNCELMWKRRFFADNYLHSIPFVLMAIAFALITTLYSIMLFKLKSQKTPGERSANAVKQRKEREKNVLRMAVAIVTGFILCWGPSNIIALFFVFVWDDTTSLSCEIATYWSITLFMAYANCAVNPCICFAFSGKYRQALKSLIRCH